MVYFELEKKDSIINSPYNTRQDQFEDRVVRGSILSADGQTLAYTQVNEDETRQEFIRLIICLHTLSDMIQMEKTAWNLWQTLS